jgi:hypothetical protein
MELAAIEVRPVPPLETGSAVVKLAEAAEMVPVAVRLASVRSPEKSPLPWTESAREGEVVPMPRNPPEVKTVESAPEVL